MPRELLLLRHAKSDWDSGAAADFDRPLAKRGRKDAPMVGAWLYREGMIPDHFVSSPAARARETAVLVCKALDLKKKHIAWEQGVYEADLAALLAVLTRVPPEALTVLMVGHNPGLEELVRFLTGDDLDEPGDGKLMPTAALARLEMPDDWSNLEAGCATVMGIVRPKQLPKRLK